MLNKYRVNDLVKGPSGLYIPSVIEKMPDGSERSFDILSRLLKDRIIMLVGEFGDEMAVSITSQLLFLEAEDDQSDIQMYINSPGGQVTSGLSITDTMDFIKPDVSTLCTGMAASMGAFTLCCGTPGKRRSLPNSTIMIHQVLGGYQGQATDIMIHAKETQRLKDLLNARIAEQTGKSLEEIVEATERDNFLTAEQAKMFGLIDEVVTRR
jgi:ATP-dependent Clp protease protease subunit